MGNKENDNFYPHVRPEGLYAPTDELRCIDDVDSLTREIVDYLRLKFFVNPRYEDGNILLELQNGQMFAIIIKDV